MGPLAREAIDDAAALHHLELSPCDQTARGLARALHPVAPVFAEHTLLGRMGAHGASQIVINPRLLVDHLARHFASYIAVMRNPANTSERARFEAMFDS
jgi:hypothetical protein